MWFKLICLVLNSFASGLLFNLVGHGGSALNTVLFSFNVAFTVYYAVHLNGILNYKAEK